VIVEMPYKMKVLNLIILLWKY